MLIFYLVFNLLIDLAYLLSFIHFSYIFVSFNSYLINFFEKS